MLAYSALKGGHWYELVDYTAKENKYLIGQFNYSWYMYL